MATIKSYTDLEQSKKLAEILPIESVDMYYQYVLPKSDKIKHNPETGNPVNALKWYNKGYTTSGKEPIILDEYCVPCWSLASLLDVLPKNLKIGRPSLESNYTGYYWIQYYDEFMKPNNYRTECFNNPVDACVAMIERLHELNLL